MSKANRARRARAEASVRRLTEQLHHAQKMQAFGEFAGSIAHDFNNMIAVVITCAASLERRLAADDPAQEEVTAIREAATRAAVLTRKLLTFARRQPSRRDLVDLHEIVARIEPILRRVVGPAIELELTLAAERRRVLGDPSYVEQALVNLAANARDAMPGGGKLGIATRDVEDANVELSVHDTGTGMDEATKARVFEPFFTTKPAGRGTGLGLSVVFGIVEDMGGTVGIDTEPGRGTTFRLRFPAT